ncbi:streptophobe family protein [Streptomyces neyagawaensis]|uniref:streptophobe family protein n=1 Tax=Streptomyces neyagawaensis TaxID=42238 RepID=UPI0006E3A130|nr:streptophobe family protein [Streptomyces neyagawaensis]MCL6732443.1 streptophobe family protein [Streptomyces neyagawaensis]MDE1685925.1 streptophobe family protein [Streptomyces neyagawaensis]
MSPQTLRSPRTVPERATARHGWLQALGTVLAALVVMVVVAALGLWAAGATDLPDNAFPRVVAATVVTAVGGTIELSGGAGAIAETQAGLTVIPLSVTLAGALVIAAGFLRPLRHRAVAGATELAGWAVRIAVLWLAALIGVSLGARQTFDIPLGDVGDFLGASADVGFETDIGSTVFFGLLWLAGILVLALLVSRAAPLPPRLLRFQESVRPAAYAMVVLLLAYVALGVVIGIVVAATRGHAAETAAVILLGLPNLVWLTFTIGLGATWDGQVEGPFGLPMPQVLDQVLRGPDVSELNLGSLAEYDERVWWLVVVDAVLLLVAAFVMAARSPARVRLWQHAVHMAVALVLTVLMICLVARISAHYGLSVIGIGDLGGDLGGEVYLRPQTWSALGLAALWGLVTGFAGGLLAKGVRRRGAVDELA